MEHVRRPQQENLVLLTMLMTAAFIHLGLVLVLCMPPHWNGLLVHVSTVKIIVTQICIVFFQETSEKIICSKTLKQ